MNLYVYLQPLALKSQTNLLHGNWELEHRSSCLHCEGSYLLSQLPILKNKSSVDTRGWIIMRKASSAYSETLIYFKSKICS